MVSTGTDVIPQVLHTDSKDLAGGNFAHMLPANGGNDTYGHNIDLLGGMGPDSILGTVNLGAPPGMINLNTHSDGLAINTFELTCAGTNGCHGVRLWDFTGNPANPEGITGAHHDNLNGSLNPNGDWEPGHGYRFLTNLKGYEDSDWEYNRTATAHNEYFALATPINYDNCNKCHPPTGGVMTIDGTISQFCATCHGNFHTIGNAFGTQGGSSGIGLNDVAPFIRHPTDLSLANLSEASGLVAYDLNAPIGRTTLGGIAGATSAVDPTSDAVMCLSCHRAHASEYPDILRWDYTAQVVGGGSLTGCLYCHTSKQ